MSQGAESSTVAQEDQCQTNIKATTDLLNIEKSTNAARKYNLKFFFSFAGFLRCE